MMLIPADLPTVVLRAPDGAQAVIAQHGAHVLAWNAPDGRERLFLSPRADFGPQAAIRGGVPVVFPQFSGQGPLIKHGFARILPWELLGIQTDAAGTATARFHLRASDASRAIWDHDFHLDLAVSVGGTQLQMALQVTNTSPQPFTFTAALHTYLGVTDVADLSVAGLGGLAYNEFGQDGVQTDPALRIQGEVDRIYWDVPGPVTVQAPDQTLYVKASGFPDVVVWNPGAERTAGLPDMEPDSYRRMLCVEAAVIGHPVTLAPGARWYGAQIIALG